MFCTKCGAQNNNGERFCNKCGSLLQNAQYPQQTVNGENSQYSSGGLTPDYINKAVNPNMTKWAILSIAIASVGIVWYWFIGLSVYIAAFLSAAGFSFAQKGEMSNKKLSTIGKVLNGILAGMAIVMLALNIINNLSK